MSSLIRTIARALARLNVEPVEGKAVTKKPAPKRQRRKGGRLTETYRALGRRTTVQAAKLQRKANRDYAKTYPEAVSLPRDDGKRRDRECARRLRQMAKQAA
ncbi:hypothetical protein ACQKQD_18925 [Methylobacterium sp. NPDC080182]|uniref:hypothetical protein n=1 Tax=Methylobacterium sp. NPDC080182 TaxID=3390590 RepID=UPI003D04554A